MRTIIDLPDNELKAVKALARRHGISQAEAIRRAVRDYLANRRDELDGEAFGLWANREHDGLAYQQAIRDEWER